MSKNRRPSMMVLPGDGIGPEVIREAVRVMEWFIAHRGFDCDVRTEEFGAGVFQRTGKIVRDEVLADMKVVDAVLFGAFGGTTDDTPVPIEVRRKGGLLMVRQELQAFANLRPIKTYAALSEASPLRPEVTRDVDMIIVRELIGGIYFGEPRGIETLADGQRRGVNTQVYTTSEIHRIGHMAFQLARRRRKQVTSVDKANVMEAGSLWRQEMEFLHANHYPDIELNHMYVDNCSMQIIRAPRQFDILVTDNLFGDILSDCGSMIAGSLGMLPSASLSAQDADGHRRAIYEPVHGSAPDIAGQDKANPLAAILSLAMAFELSFDRPDDAQLLDKAVEAALATKKRTADIAEPGSELVSTTGMSDAVLDALDRLAR